MLDDLLHLVDDFCPDVMIHEEIEFAAPLVAELRGLPCVTHSWPSPARPAAEREGLASLLAPLWEEHAPGRKPRQSGEHYLDACPPMFQTDAIESIPGVWAIQPVPFDGPPSTPPAWLDHIEHPAAYVSFGTVGAFAQPQVIQAAVEAVSQVVATTIVTTGPNPAEAVRPSTPTVHVEQYISQSHVLPHVDVVVSHGGAGTTLGALLHGLPQLVLPQNAGSQLRNAERVEALRIGRHIQEGVQEPLALAVSSVLADPVFAEQARQVREAVLQLPSPDSILAQLRNELAQKR
jgi:UDP:flavonoid glycosyltransferase YjiC (YdhE family)